MADQQDVGEPIGLEPLPGLRHVGVDQLLVGVDGEEPAAVGSLDRLVAVEGEVVPPGVLVHRGPEVPGDPDRVVGRAGVDHHDLVREGTEALEAAAEVLGLVTDDEAGAQER